MSVGQAFAFSVLQELAFIDGLGQWSVAGMGAGRIALLRGYLKALGVRRKDFGGGAMSDGTKAMLRGRANLHLGAV